MLPVFGMTPRAWFREFGMLSVYTYCIYEVQGVETRRRLREPFLKKSYSAEFTPPRCLDASQPVSRHRPS